MPKGKNFGKSNGGHNGGASTRVTGQPKKCSIDDPRGSQKKACKNRIKGNSMYCRTCPVNA